MALTDDPLHPGQRDGPRDLCSELGRDFPQARRLFVGVLFCALLFAGCRRESSTGKASSVETSPGGNSATTAAPAPSDPAKAAGSSEVRQAMAEAEKSLRSGSYDEAAARLLKMRMSGTEFSPKDAAAYREALQDAYSRALEAASKGDPRGKAAVELIRAAKPR